MKLIGAVVQFTLHTYRWYNSYTLFTSLLLFSYAKIVILPYGL